MNISIEDQDDQNEYIFHQQLTWIIIGLSPIIFFILLCFRVPTYGKHTRIEPSSSSMSTKNDDDNNNTMSSVLRDADADATTDTIHNMSLPSSSSTTLRQRRKSNSNNHDVVKEQEEERDNDSKTIMKDKPQDQKKRQRHWLGPLLPSKLAWFIFESPCWIWVLVCLYNNIGLSLLLPFKNQLLLGWFFFHYIYRSILYPFMMTTTSSSDVPFGIAFMAFLYCFINGYLQSKYLTKFYDTSKYNSSSSSSNTKTNIISNYNFEFGIVLIIIGFSIVFTSDRILLNLKKQQLMKKRMVNTTSTSKNNNNNSNNNNKNSHTSHYSIPYGGLFYLVSSPHYFGELLEWIGFCIASNYSLCSLSFVLWTAANLIPRSIHTHNWYKKTFQDNNNHHDSNDNDDVDDDDDDEEDWVVVDVNYSDLNRKAIIPFIL